MDFVKHNAFLIGYIFKSRKVGNRVLATYTSVPLKVLTNSIE